MANRRKSSTFGNFGGMGKFQIVGVEKQERSFALSTYVQLFLFPVFSVTGKRPKSTFAFGYHLAPNFMGQSTLDASGNPGCLLVKSVMRFNRARAAMGNVPDDANVAPSSSPRALPTDAARQVCGFPLNAERRPAAVPSCLPVLCASVFVPVKSTVWKLFFQAAQLVADRGRIAVHKAQPPCARCLFWR